MENINILIASFLTGDITPDELTRLEKWLDESQANRLVFDKIKLAWKEDAEVPKLENTEVLIDKLWLSVIKEPQKTTRFNNRQISKRGMRIAATVSILLCAIWIGFYQSGIEGDKFISQEIIIKENPSGQKSRIHLSDGTLVWLNASSSITYEKGFNDSVRNVKLKGEAFFEVARDTSRRFVVTTDDLTVTALGTSFNVSAFENDNNTSVSLVTGKVGVKETHNNFQEVYMLPGKKLIYRKALADFKEDTFSTQDLGWKDGILIFKADTYAQFIEKMERWYGVSIKSEGQIPFDWELTAYYENQSLETILKNIQYQKGFNYEIINGETIVLKF